MKFNKVHRIRSVLDSFKQLKGKMWLKLKFNYLLVVVIFTKPLEYYSQRCYNTAFGSLVKSPSGMRLKHNFNDRYSFEISGGFTPKESFLVQAHLDWNYSFF